MKINHSAFHIKCLLFHIFFVVCVCLSSAQPPLSHTTFTRENGYLQGIVTHLHQDVKGFVWIATADGLFRFDGYEFKEFRRVAEDSTTLRSNTITKIESDQKGNLWVGTQGGGLGFYDRSTAQFTNYHPDGEPPFKLPGDFLTDVLLDQQGQVWLGFDKYGLIVLDPSNNEKVRYLPIPGEANSISSFEIECLIEDPNGNIWIGTRNGLNYFDKKTKTWTQYFHDPQDDNSLSNNDIRTLYFDKKDQLWVGTNQGLNQFLPAQGHFQRIETADIQKNAFNGEIKALGTTPYGQLAVGTEYGLFFFDESKQEVIKYQAEEEATASVFNTNILSMLLDQQNLLWVGTWGGALNRLENEKQLFSFWGEEQLPAVNTKSIYQTEEKVLWIGTRNSGVNRIDRLNNELKVFNTDNGLSHNTVYALEGNKEGVWIGTSVGLNYYHKASKKLYSYFPNKNIPGSLPHRIVWALKYNHKGQLWIGTEDGLALLEDYEVGDPQLNLKIFKNDPNELESLASNSIRCLEEDRNNDLWIGTSDAGLCFMDTKRQVFRSYASNDKDPESIASKYCFSICEDQDGFIWVGNSKGASKLDRKTGKFTHLTEEDGLPNDLVFSIKEDEEANLWMSTNRGVFHYMPKTKQYRVYDALDGLQDDEFNQGAYFKDETSGEIFWGGINGVNSILPEQITYNEFLPPIVITKLEYYNRSSQAQASSIPYIGNEDRIDLQYSDNIIKIEFAALNYLFPEKNQFRYQLKGFNNRWFDLGNTHDLTFTNLDHGKYTLHLQGANDDGIWNEEGKKLDIYLAPPWHQTPLAKFSFLIGTVLLLIVFFTYLLNRRLAKQEHERLQELDKLKTKFFTNITHEFRTPLTVILGMVDTFKGNQKAVQLIKRSSYNMLNLVNQMLDLRRLESGVLPVNMVQADMISYLKYITESFNTYAERQEIQLHFLPEIDHLLMDFDPDKILRIMSNLLSNAVKYNQQNGNVYVQADQLMENGKNHLLIRVRDTGIGISQEEIPYIFDRFYRVEVQKDQKQKGGTGVGLSLTKELVKLFKGSIEVDSKLGSGSIFTMKLPVENNASITDVGAVERLGLEHSVAKSVLISKAEIPIRTEVEQVVNHTDRHSLLVVEDNPDVAEYLKTCLSAHYHIEVAYDGAAGVSRALDIVPDVIVSDIMMPKKDGFELLKELKQDERTSHIPIIMLSAKADLQSRLIGLNTGADAYLAKPFHQEELLAQVNNLLQIRKALQEHYQKEVQKEESVEVMDPFLGKVTAAIEDHMSNEQFGILDLCKVLSVSRTQLHNKLKALTGMSASHFINSVKLRKGRNLLQNTQLSVSEVAYSIGYKEPNYFSKLYQEHFGQRPSDVRK